MAVWIDIVAESRLFDFPTESMIRNVENLKLKTYVIS